MGIVPPHMGLNHPIPQSCPNNSYIKLFLQNLHMCNSIVNSIHLIYIVPCQFIITSTIILIYNSLYEFVIQYTCV